jgi:hypothetical protein
MMTFIVVLFLFFSHNSAQYSTDGFIVEQISFIQLNNTCSYKNSSTLSLVYSPSYENSPFLLAHFHGSHYDIGYCYGEMLAERGMEDFDLLIDSVISDQWEQEVLNIFLDWQWSEYLSKQLPLEYQQELKGIEVNSTPYFQTNFPFQTIFPLFLLYSRMDQLRMDFLNLLNMYNVALQFQTFQVILVKMPNGY